MFRFSRKIIVKIVIILRVKLEFLCDKPFVCNKHHNMDHELMVTWWRHHDRLIFLMFCWNGKENTVSKGSYETYILGMNKSSKSAQTNPVQWYVECPNIISVVFCWRTLTTRYFPARTQSVITVSSSSTMETAFPSPELMCRPMSCGRVGEKNLICHRGNVFEPQRPRFNLRCNPRVYNIISRCLITSYLNHAVTSACLICFLTAIKYLSLNLSTTY